MSAIVHSPREQWLARRRELITASDVAAILGEDPHRGALAVWAAKVGAIEQDETVPMRRGKRFEAAIAEEYADQTGRPVAALGEYEIQIHRDLPWLGATLDRLTKSVEACPGPLPMLLDLHPGTDAILGVRAGVPLQLKMAIGSAKAWQDENPPLAYEVQCQVEMACFSAPWGALAGLIGPGPLVVFDMLQDAAFFAAIIPHLERFRRHVETKTPPTADGKPGTTEAIRKLWPNASGESCTLTAEDQAAMDELEAARARAAAAEHTERGLANQLHARMQGAAHGALPDGSFVRRNRVERKAYDVEASSHVTLKRWWPRYRAR